jgi:ATP-dependent Clp protease ATP-binding subunit ClpA
MVVPPTRAVFDRLSPRGQDLLALAATEALRDNFSTAISTGHLLLALAGQRDEFVSRCFARAGLTASLVREAVVAEHSTESVGGSSFSHANNMLFTRVAEKVLSAALVQAVALADDYVDPHHVLLALLEEPGSNALHILRRLGFTPHQLGSVFFETVNVNDS